MIRLDRYLANLGLVSRREIPRWIKKQEILIDTIPATAADQKISYGSTISFAGQDIVVQEFVYIMLHKASGYVSSDVAEGRYPSYRELLYDCPYRNIVHVAGRLDYDTEGLLLLSNDGKRIHSLISPKKKCPKKYFVQIAQPLSSADIATLQDGVTLDDGYHTQPAQLEIIDLHHIYLTITEGKFHQVKRMLQAVNNQVLYLRRESIGEYTLGNLLLQQRQYISG